MTLEDGHFVLSVPSNGSMVFSEAGTNWTFAGLVQEVNDYTDELNAEASMYITALVSTSVHNMMVRSFISWLSFVVVRHWSYRCC